MKYSEIREFFEQSNSSAARSTILKSLTWALSIFVLGIISLVKYKAPDWLLILFSVFLSLAILIFFFAYLYCLFKDRDALRSEKYSIQKLAIEKGLLGDNRSGVFEEADVTEISIDKTANRLGGGSKK